MNKNIKFGNFTVGFESPVFIIAEVGVNHNGDLKLALDLIKQAAKCGADCVKFQTFKAERVVIPEAPKAHYQLKTTYPKESQLDMLKKLELNKKFYKEIIKCCDSEGVFFMSTPYNVEDLEFLIDLDIQAFKLASIHVAEPGFASHVANTGKPVILSTGMANLGEIDQTVNAMRATGNNDVILLQCTTNYPSLPEDSNLLAMKSMRDAFDILVGYSDHTEGDIACVASVALGAKVIEKHFTLDKSLSGPDQSSSSDPQEFARLVQNIKLTESCLGSGIKHPTKTEIRNAFGMRRSIVAKIDIPAGSELKMDHFTYKRPGTGISPTLIDHVIGRKAYRSITTDQLIDWSDIE